jgi:hypothetical protein
VPAVAELEYWDRVQMAQEALLRMDNSTAVAVGLVEKMALGSSTEWDQLAMAEGTAPALVAEPPIYITEIEQYTEIHLVAAQSELSGVLVERFRLLTRKRL